jgi:hypothetical protein
MGFKMKGSTFYGKSPLKQKQGQADPSKDYKKKDKPYFKSSAETMVPPYKRPVGPTEKRHGIHKGSAIMDGMDTEFQPYKTNFEKRPHLKSPTKNYKKGYYGVKK